MGIIILLLQNALEIKCILFLSKEFVLLPHWISYRTEHKARLELHKYATRGFEQAQQAAP